MSSPVNADAEVPRTSQGYSEGRTKYSILKSRQTQNEVLEAAFEKRKMQIRRAVIEGPKLKLIQGRSTVAPGREKNVSSHHFHQRGLLLPTSLQTQRPLEWPGEAARRCPLPQIPGTRATGGVLACALHDGSRVSHAAILVLSAPQGGESVESILRS